MHGEVQALCFLTEGRVDPPMVLSPGTPVPIFASIHLPGRLFRWFVDMDASGLDVTSLFYLSEKKLGLPPK